MSYLFGILITLLSECLLSVANIFDGQLSRKTFSSVWSVVTLNGLLVIPALPILFLLLNPSMLSMNQFYLILLISSLEFLYQIPYYLALREAETSVVVLMFNFEKIFVPILAYLIIGEQLTLLQYFGFSIIVTCSLVASFDRTKFTWNKAIFYMLVASLILAFDGVMQKYGLRGIEWGTFYFWMLCASLPYYLLILIIFKKVRAEIIEFVKHPLDRRYLPVFAQNISTLLGNGLGVFGLSLLPITIKKLIESFPSLLVHLLASKSSKALNIDDPEHFSFGRLLLLAIGSMAAFLTLLEK